MNPNKTDRVLTAMESLEFLQEEIVDLLINELRRGKALTESAQRCGYAFLPLSRNAFLVAAQMGLEVSPEMAYFHVELSDFLLAGERYTGGVFIVCDPNRVSVESMLALFHFAGLIISVEDATTNLEGCLAQEDPAIRSQQIAGLVN